MHGDFKLDNVVFDAGKPGRLVGVLSDRDLLRAVASKKPQRVADIMTRDMVKELDRVISDWE